MGGFAIPVNERAAVKNGTGLVAHAGTVTITFPSARFCRKYVDDEFLDHIRSHICGMETTYKGNGEVDVGFSARCGHIKLTGGDAIGWDWGQGLGNKNTVFIRGYGEKSGRGAKGARTGGYTWQTG